MGATANDRCNITGTASTRAALAGGQIDMYWEYTGTGWITAPQERQPDPGVAGAVRRGPRRRPGSEPDRLAAAVAVQQHLRPRGDPGRSRSRTTCARSPTGPTSSTAATRRRPLCVEAEFAGRDDGLAGLFRTYGVTNPPSGPPGLNTLDTGAIYQATANGNPCNFGEVFTTDGRIPGLNLATLQDDKNYFPKYNASPTIRKEVFDRNPSVQRVFDEITPRLTDQVMLDLNGQVSSQGQDPDPGGHSLAAAAGVHRRPVTPLMCS